MLPELASRQRLTQSMERTCLTKALSPVFQGIMSGSHLVMSHAGYNFGMQPLFPVICVAFSAFSIWLGVRIFT